MFCYTVYVPAYPYGVKEKIMLTVVQLLSLSGQVLALNIHDPNLRLVVGGLAITLTGISVFMTERRQLS